MPTFTPEHFVIATDADAQRQKQFCHGLEQLADEGVIQLFQSDTHGPQVPIVGAVGPMQFEVFEHRMEHELNAAVTLTPLPYTVLRTITSATANAWVREPGVLLARRPHGEAVALFANEFQAQRLTDRLPRDVRLEP